LPTFRWLPRFGADFGQLTPAQQAAFLATVALFVEDLQADRPFRNGGRVKGVKGAPGVFEMTWAPDGRATFRFGEPVREGEAHIVWWRIGTHAIFNQP
jgi:hypothetical protein